MDNCCEYISQDGEVKHVLQLFCECEDLDETFTKLVSPSTRTRDGGSNVPRVGSRWQRLLDVMQDRARIPWPGGARRVDLGWLVAASLLNLLRWQIRRSQTLAAGTISLAACFGGLAYSHLRALRQRSSSQFHMAWLTLSIMQSYWRYSERIRHSLPSTADAAAHIALVLMLTCYLHCCVADPGRDELVNTDMDTDDCASVPGAMGVMTPQERLHRSTVLRSGRCSICRCTFRLRDHHCVWVGQCIAERNRRTFLLFLFLLSGLSLWFASNMLALSAGEVATCQGGTAEKLLTLQVGHILCLVVQNVGGEDIGDAIYALVAGILAVALAAQQCLLVGAGVTSLELRRSRGPGKPSKTPSAKDSRPLLDGSRDNPHGIARTRCHRVILFPQAGIFYHNWKRFLLGIELPRNPPNISTTRSRPNVVENNHRRYSCGGKIF